MKKEGVIFDMDGLMFDTQSIYNKAFVDIGLHDYGIHITEDFLVAVMGQSGDGMYNTVNRFFPDIDAFKYVQKVYSLVAERVKTDLVARPGLYELLPYLKKEGYKLAVSSGSDRSIVMSNLETSGLTDYFSVVVCGDDMYWRTALTVSAPDIGRAVQSSWFPVMSSPTMRSEACAPESIPPLHRSKKTWRQVFSKLCPDASRHYGRIFLRTLFPELHLLYSLFS